MSRNEDLAIKLPIAYEQECEAHRATKKLLTELEDKVLALKITSTKLGSTIYNQLFLLRELIFESRKNR